MTPRNPPPSTASPRAASSVCREGCVGLIHRADKLTAYANVSVTGDMARNTPAVDFGTWRQSGAIPGRVRLNLTLGTTYELTEKWSVNAAYRMDPAENVTQQRVNVGATLRF